LSHLFPSMAFRRVFDISPVDSIDPSFLPPFRSAIPIIQLPVAHPTRIRKISPTKSLPRTGSHAKIDPPSLSSSLVYSPFHYPFPFPLPLPSNRSQYSFPSSSNLGRVEELNHLPISRILPPVAMASVSFFFLSQAGDVSFPFLRLARYFTTFLICALTETMVIDPAFSTTKQVCLFMGPSPPFITPPFPLTIIHFVARTVRPSYSYRIPFSSRILLALNRSISFPLPSSPADADLPTSLVFSFPPPVRHKKRRRAPFVNFAGLAKAIQVPPKTTFRSAPFLPPSATLGNFLRPSLFLLGSADNRGMPFRQSP